MEIVIIAIVCSIIAVSGIMLTVQNLEESKNLTTVQKIWVEIDPIQCMGNPWEKDWWDSHDEYYSRDHLEQIGVIKNYYEKQDIEIFDARIGTWGGEIAVCEACDCSDGYTLYLLISESDVDTMVNLNYKISKEDSLKHVDNEIHWMFRPYEYWQDGKHDMTCEGLDCNNGYRDTKCGIEENGLSRYGFLIKDNGLVVSPKERGILYSNAIIDYGLCMPIKSCSIQCLVYDPVCGVDGITYSCGVEDAACHEVEVEYEGECVGN
jgi:hypothetical protein